MNNKNKISRYETIIQTTINNAIRFEINNKYAKFATITYVNLTNELSIAKIYIDCLNREKINIVLEELNKVKGFLRSKVAKALNLYKTPELIFQVDKTIDYSNKIEQIFKNLNEKEK